MHLHIFSDLHADMAGSYGDAALYSICLRSNALTHSR